MHVQCTCINICYVTVCPEKYPLISIFISFDFPLSKGHGSYTSISSYRVAYMYVLDELFIRYLTPSYSNEAVLYDKTY